LLLLLVFKKLLESWCLAGTWVDAQAMQLLFQHVVEAGAAGPSLTTFQLTAPIFDLQLVCTHFRQPLQLPLRSSRDC
jgi:hypothetical protein